MAPTEHVPDDFGMDAVSTLSHVGDPSPAIEHAPHWNQWLKVVQAGDRPKLTLREPGGSGAARVDPSDTSATHGLVSLGDVRIGARLQLPPRGTPIRAGLVTTHGYSASSPLSDRDALFAPVVDRGVAVLHLRIRGFPGSRLDCGDMTKPIEPGMGWICRGLDDDDETAEGFMKWSYAQGVADLFHACRAMRWWLNATAGPLADLYMHGESFGGGLAVAALAKLTGRADSITEVHRLALALPTMGDWPWRLRHTVRHGSGAEIARLLAARPKWADIIKARLRVADSVILASRVRCPVLCKLAQRDEVVPAPTAGAIFNALAVDPGMKWRFIVPHGHAETGVANARRHAEFQRCMMSFLDPDRRPDDAVAAWSAHATPQAEPVAEASASLFGPGDTSLPDAGIEQLIRAYEAGGRTLDDLPYTEEFEQLYTTVAKAMNTDRRGVFHKLHNLRKAGKLPRLGRAASSPPRLNPEDEERLIALVTQALGDLGRRDQLPFTPEFDMICQGFNAASSRDMTPHDLWRVIAKLAK